MNKNSFNRIRIGSLVRADFDEESFDEDKYINKYTIYIVIGYNEEEDRYYIKDEEEDRYYIYECDDWTLITPSIQKRFLEFVNKEG